MRKLILVGLIISAPYIAGGQQRFPPINLYNGDPTGKTCTGNLIQQSETTGLLYTCQAGAMKVQGNPAAGGGTVTGQASGVIPLGTATTVIGAQSPLSVSGGVVTSTGAIVAPSLTATGLTPGLCAQIGTGGLITSSSAACGNGANVSGQLNGYVPLASAPTSLTAPSVIDQGISNANSVTIGTLYPIYAGQNGTGSVVAGALPGYRQNATFASRDRDGVLSVTITPQDPPGCANAGLGNIDDAPCFNAAIQYLNSFDDRASKRLIVPFTQQGYTFRSNGYLLTLPGDTGDYHGYAGSTTPAAVGLQFVSGILSSCTVSGGTGYTPSANLPVLVTDSTLVGSGASATVQTNSSGVPTGCTVVTAGINYPSVGPTATVIPLGGDGAAGTASLTSGTFATTSTVSAGGSGYITGVPVGAPGLTCTTYPVFTATVASNAVTAVTNTAGSGCTYAASSTATVPLVFGASCSGAQCTLLAPETPANQPCAVALINNLTIEGIGRPTISTGWSTTAADTNQLIAFCDPTGKQSTNITLRNLTINNTFIGLYFPGEVYNLRADAVTFSGIGIPIYAYSINGQDGTTNTADPPRSYWTNTQVNNAYVGGAMCGAAWAGRNPITLSGSYTAMLLSKSHTNPDWTGRCAGLDVQNWSGQMNTWSQTQLNNFDKWVETYLWKSQNGPTTPNASVNPLSNGKTTCALTNTIVDRTTDYNFGYLTVSGGTAAAYPYSQCFPGVARGGFMFYPRYSQNDGFSGASTSFTSVTFKDPGRPLFSGRFDTTQINRVFYQTENASITDPYVVSGQVIGTLNFTANTQTKARLEDVLGTNYTINAFLNGTSSTTALYIRNVTGNADSFPLPSLFSNTVTLSNTTTGVGIGVSASEPYIYWVNSSAVTDAKVADMLVDTNGSQTWRFLNDAHGSVNNWLRVNRSGFTVTNVTFYSPLVQNGSTSGSITFQAPAVAGSNTVTWPAATGTVALTTQINLVAALTTTAATSDNVTVTGMTASGHCSLTATNATAATNSSTTYVSAKTTNQITVTHTAIASMTYDVSCTSY